LLVAAGGRRLFIALMTGLLLAIIPTLFFRLLNTTGELWNQPSMIALVLIDVAIPFTVIIFLCEKEGNKLLKRARNTFFIVYIAQMLFLLSMGEAIGAAGGLAFDSVRRLVWGMLIIPSIVALPMLAIGYYRTPNTQPPSPTQS